MSPSRDATLDAPSPAGVAADWARLAAHIGRVLPGLVAAAQPPRGLTRQWSLRWQGQRFALTAYVHSPPGYERIIASNLGGEPSTEQIGDFVVELYDKPNLLWQFKNVVLELRLVAAHQPEQTARRAQMLRLARAVQSFLDTALVSDLLAVTPRLTITMPAQTTILLGQPLRLAYQAAHAAPGECHLDIRSDGFEHVTRGATEITVTPVRVGPVALTLCLQNTRNGLQSPFNELGFRSVRAPGQGPVTVQARYLDDASIQYGPGWQPVLDRDRHASDRAVIFVIRLDAQLTAVMQFRGPQFSNAMPSIAMRLEAALLLGGSGAPILLCAPEFHIDQSRFPDIRGTISRAEQDWEITAASAGAAANGDLLDELRRLGLDVVASAPAPGGPGLPRPW